MKRIILFILLIVAFGCTQKKKNIIKIGRILPLTGDAASYGKSEQKGTLLALDEINNSNYLEGKKLDIIFENDNCDVKTGVNAMNKLINIDKVQIVLGATCSGVTLALAPIANENKVLLLSPLSSAADITNAGPYVFRIMPSDAYQSKILAHWIFSEGYKNIAMLSTNNAWGKGVSKEFVKDYTKLGGNIILKEECEVGERNFKTQLTKIINASPGALFCPTMPIEGGIILKQLKELNVSFPVFGADAWSVEDLLTTAGNAANGVRYVYPSKYNGKEYQDFAKAFRKKYGKEPDVNVAGAYDAVKITAMVIKELLDKHMPITGENMRIEMSKVRGYHGATGTTTFDENGDPINKNFEKMIIMNGKRMKYEK